MRFRKQYLSDITSTIVPSNLNKHARLAQVISVEAEKGVCTIRFLDTPSTRSDVILVQPSSGIFNIPEVGNIVIVVFDKFERPYIVGYINLGHESRVRKLNTLPKFKPGEKFFEAGGSYFYIRKNGNIIISTLTGNYLEIENTSGSLKFESVNWKVITEGGILYFGIVKRLVKDEKGNLEYKPITSFNGDAYTELSLKVIEKADGSLGIDPNASPLIEMTLGTLVDKEGNVVDKNLNKTLYSNKEVLLHLKLKNGVQIDIDKEGRLSIKNMKININEGSVDYDDPDIALGLEKNNALLGTRGQHVAREHDEVTIPISTQFESVEHKTLSEKNLQNLNALQTLAMSIISPMGPCFLNLGVLGVNNSLKGEITSGAKDVIVGGE